MSKVLEKIKEIKNSLSKEDIAKAAKTVMHKMTNYRNSYVHFMQYRGLPGDTVHYFAESLVKYSTKGLSYTQKEDLIESFYIKFVDEIKGKTILFKPFLEETPKNKVSYWGAIYEFSDSRNT